MTHGYVVAGHVNHYSLVSSDVGHDYRLTHSSVSQDQQWGLAAIGTGLDWTVNLDDGAGLTDPGVSEELPCGNISAFL